MNETDKQTIPAPFMDLVFGVMWQKSAKQRHLTCSENTGLLQPDRSLVCCCHHSMLEWDLELRGPLGGQGLVPDFMFDLWGYLYHALQNWRELIFTLKFLLWAFCLLQNKKKKTRLKGEMHTSLYQVSTKPSGYLSAVNVLNQRRLGGTMWNDVCVKSHQRKWKSVK